MKISIFTPTHDTKYLLETYESIRSQLFFEWVIVENNGAHVPAEIREDPRVKVFQFESKNVGALKKFACSKCEGDILLELDHDDQLTPNCIYEVATAFTQTGADMVYSNSAHVNMDWSPATFGEYWGWKNRDFNYKGHEIKEIVSGEPYPSNVSIILYAPDHVRAWKRSFYEKIGGHNPDMKVADDHDLICRSFIHGKIHHIDKCLYIYFVHGDNTWLQNCDEIQSAMWENHNKYFYEMAEKWAQNEGLPIYDLGGGIDKPAGYTSVDLRNADITADLNDDFPIADNSAGVIRAHDILEHLKNPIHAMNECYRSLVHGGLLLIQVPATDGRGAFCDPTHVSFWNERSFRYYTEKSMRRYIEPTCKCRFQVVKLRTVNKYDNLPYVEAELIAIKKDSPRFHGELLI